MDTNLQRAQAVERGLAELHQARVDARLQQELRVLVDLSLSMPPPLWRPAW